mmetsp:Transcript_24888/g.57704  ORF Transcript_24888/g.57704 Transcript_24888/m.57704 type:complete len:207 (-) Transcript_24888:529-1149(-)
MKNDEKGERSRKTSVPYSLTVARVLGGTTKSDINGRNNEENGEKQSERAHSGGIAHNQPTTQKRAPPPACSGEGFFSTLHYTTQNTRPWMHRPPVEAARAAAARAEPPRLARAGGGAAPNLSVEKVRGGSLDRGEQYGEACRKASVQLRLRPAPGDELPRVLPCLGQALPDTPLGLEPVAEIDGGKGQALLKEPREDHDPPHGGRA